MVCMRDRDSPRLTVVSKPFLRAYVSAARRSAGGEIFARGRRSSVEMKSFTSQVRAIRFRRSIARFMAVADAGESTGFTNRSRPKALRTLTNRPPSLAKATGPKITLDAYCGDEIGS